MDRKDNSNDKTNKLYKQIDSIKTINELYKNINVNLNISTILTKFIFSKKTTFSKTSIIFLWIKMYSIITD